ncbi:MAG: hypothetical protein KGL35_29320 [Bradyrhizobium sp.]|nr:hypothetical protein [Bradyrhizobium sp.]
MIVQEHTFVAGRCLWCGAKDMALLCAEWRAMGNMGDPEPDTRSCIKRDNYSGRLRPEPYLRLYGCEDSEAISKRLIEIEAERRPKCPITGSELRGCLSGAPCPERCEHRDLQAEVKAEADAAAGAFC